MQGISTTTNEYGRNYSYIRALINQDYNILSNSSVITVTLQIKSSRRATYYFDGKISVNGSVVINSYNYAQGLVLSEKDTWATVVEKSVSIEHRADGSQSIDVVFTGSKYDNFKFIDYQHSDWWFQIIGGTTETFELTTIPRSSSVSVPTSYIEHEAIISISSASPSFTHTLTYSFGGLSGTISNKTSSISVNWVVPYQFYGQIPSSSSGTATINCITYNGETEIGRSSVNFKILADPNLCSPSISPTIDDINSTTLQLTGSKDTFIRYYSDADIRINATALKGSYIVEEFIKCGSKTIKSDSGVIDNIESGDFYISVKDSRGFITSNTIKKNIVEYVALTSNVVADPPTTDGSMTVKFSGNYFNNSFGLYYNTLSLQYRIKKDSESYGNWINVQYNLVGNKYSAAITLNGLDYRSVYVVQAKAVDRLNEVLASSDSMRAIPIFSWGKDQFTFNVPVNINGTLTVSGGKSDAYPVGSIYISGVKQSPAELFGGEWVRIKQKFLFGCDGNGGYENGATGGEFSHTLTVDEMPSHSHDFLASPNRAHEIVTGGDVYNTDQRTAAEVTHTTKSSGGGLAHNNMPPYLAVYMWQRIS